LVQIGTELVRDVLESVCDRVADAGFLVIDDYGVWQQGAHRATDALLAGIDLRHELLAVDFTARLWQKPIH